MVFNLQKAFPKIEVPVYNCLMRNGIHTHEKLAEQTDYDLSKICHRGASLETLIEYRDKARLLNFWKESKE